MPSTKFLLSSVINQPPTFIPTTFRVSTFQPGHHTHTFNLPTCAPFSNQLGIFDGTDYQWCPENFLKSRHVVFVNLVPKLQIQKSVAFGSFEEWLLLLLPSMTLLDLSLTILLKMTLKIGLSFQQNL